MGTDARVIYSIPQQEIDEDVNHLRNQLDEEIDSNKKDRLQKQISLLEDAIMIYELPKRLDIRNIWYIPIGEHQIKGDSQ